MSNPKPITPRRRMNATISTAVSRRLRACCSRMLRPSLMARCPLAEAQVHLRDGALRLRGHLEELARLEPEEPGDEVGGENLLGDVELGGDIVVELAEV